MARIEISPADAEDLNIQAGDIVEVFNDHGLTHAMCVPEPTIKPGRSFMLFAQENGTVGDLVTPWVDRNVVPYYKGTWASIRRVSTSSEFKKTISFKSRQWT